MKIKINKNKVTEKISIIIGVILIVCGGLLFFKSEEKALDDIKIQDSYEETYQDWRNTPKVEESKVKEFSKQKINYITAEIVVEGKLYPLTFVVGDSLLDAMTTAMNEGILFFRGKEFSGLGVMVEEINGKKTEKGYSWIYYVNGKQGAVGVSSYILKAGDVIEWKYEKEY